jgi:PhzF family phenazine biosynthesis protein
MQIPIHQLNAFTQQPFCGNPAAVCPLPFWLPDAVLMGIARDNNLSETAFYVSEPEGLRIRWFTPAREVTLCGHATLATAKVWFDANPAASVVRFQSLSGWLTVTRDDNHSLTLDFPSRAGVLCEPPPHLQEALGVSICECHRSVDDLLVIVKDEATVRRASPDFRLLAEVDVRGVIVSAAGTDVDFVSRFFAPKVGVDEDPVTGSAHCVLTPYWARKLGKTLLNARQISARGGELVCELQAEGRILITGFCQPYLRGEISVEI